MSWNITYIEPAEKDLEKLDNSQRIQVLKAIVKAARNPLPKSEGGYGLPLGNHNDTKLAGYMKIRLLKPGIRVVYRLERTGTVMKIIVILAKADNEVYFEAQKRK